MNNKSDVINKLKQAGFSLWNLDKNHIRADKADVAYFIEITGDGLMIEAAAYGRVGKLDRSFSPQPRDIDQLSSEE
jgi:hypothetical protein